MLHLLEKENFGRNPYRKRGSRCNWEDNIERNPQENGWDDVDCDATQTKGQWGDFVKTVMKQQITRKVMFVYLFVFLALHPFWLYFPQPRSGL
jgi:hypothetical protein